MAANKPGVMIYFETLQAIDALSPEDTKQIIGAILRYARDGESPSLHGALAALWFFIKPSLDRDGARYDEMRTRGLWLTYCRKCKKEGIEPLPFEEWAAQQTVDGMLSCCEQPVERRVNVGPPSTTTPSSSPSSSSSTPSPSSASIESKEGRGEEKLPASNWAEFPPKQSGAAAPTPSGSSTKKKFGAYGWVRLNDDEYTRLLDELGEAELQRCIAYIDESAQSSGNKNKWKDWNLVIRRCSRDRWGIRNGSMNGNADRRCSAGDAMDNLQQLHQMYESWEGEQDG